MASAIDIIKQEHRNHVAVLQCLEGLISDQRRGVGSPDFGLFRTMLAYFDGFLNVFHHPKEDQHLFKVLMERDPAAAELIHTLESQHKSGYAEVARLKTLLDAFETDTSDATATAFYDAAEAYHKHEWDHMRTEEMQILPLARKVLSDEDWTGINDAFSDHADPLKGGTSEEKFQKLMHAIAARAPAPHGLADPA